MGPRLCLWSHLRPATSQFARRVNAPLHSRHDGGRRVVPWEPLARFLCRAAIDRRNAIARTRRNRLLCMEPRSQPCRARERSGRAF